MSVKWIGAILIVMACGGFGFLMAANYRREEKNLRQLVRVLQYMSWELEYRLTPLPELCIKASQQANQDVEKILINLAQILDGQVFPVVENCMTEALVHSPALTPITKEACIQMGASLGQFDLSGQLKGLDSVNMFCERELDKLTQHKEQRLRSYQTLGLCAGAALAIIFI